MFMANFQIEMLNIFFLELSVFYGDLGSREDYAIGLKESIFECHISKLKKQ